MKVLIAFCFIAFSFSSATTLSAQSSSLAEAKSVFKKALADFNSGNYEAYLSVIAPDFEGYTGIYTPLRFEGKDAWAEFINGLKNYSSANYDQRQPDYRNYGDNTVLCNAYFVFTTVSKNGVIEVQSGRETTVLVKVNNKWMIANYHFSPMF